MITSNRLAGDKGLTLVEVLIAMGISAIVGGLLLIIMVNSAGLFYKESSKVGQGLNINDALMQIRSSVKGATSIVSAYNSYTSSESSIILKIPSINSSGNIIADVFDYLVFYQDQTKLHFKSFPDTQSSRQAQDRIFSTNLNSLSIKYLNSATPPQEVAPVSATKIEITVSLKQTMGAVSEEHIATTEASLRND